MSEYYFLFFPQDKTLLTRTQKFFVCMRALMCVLMCVCVLIYMYFNSEVQVYAHVHVFVSLYHFFIIF